MELMFRNLFGQHQFLRIPHFLTFLNARIWKGAIQSSKCPRHHQTSAVCTPLIWSTAFFKESHWIIFRAYSARCVAKKAYENDGYYWCIPSSCTVFNLSSNTLNKKSFTVREELVKSWCILPAAKHVLVSQAAENLERTSFSNATVQRRNEDKATDVEE